MHCCFVLIIVVFQIHSVGANPLRLLELIYEQLFNMAKNLRSTTMSLDEESLKNLTTQISAAVTATLSADIKKQFDAVTAALLQVKDTVDSNSLQLRETRQNFDRLEQYTRRNNLRFFGILETENEDTDSLILAILRDKLQISISTSDVERTHRVGKASDRNRCIIVKFVSYRKRSEVYSLKSKLKNTKLIISEDLTKLRYTAYKAALKKYGPRSVWTRDGEIMWKKDGRISKASQEDIVGLVEDN